MYPPQFWACNRCPVSSFGKWIIAGFLAFHTFLLIPFTNFLYSIFYSYFLRFFIHLAYVLH